MDGMVEEPETRMDDEGKGEGAGAAKVAVIDDDAFEELFSRMKPRMAEEVVRVCQERGYMTKEDAQSMVREIATMTIPAAKPGQEEPATRADADPEKEPEVMDRAKDEAVSALKREALKVANDEALRMVRERRLPSARIDRFVSLSLEGEDTAHLLVDGAAMSTPVGRSAGATASEPARKQETVVLTREAARIRHELYSENLDEAEFNKALTDRMKALTRDAAKRGAKVVDNDGDEETDD